MSIRNCMANLAHLIFEARTATTAPVPEDNRAQVARVYTLLALAILPALFALTIERASAVSVTVQYDAGGPDAVAPCATDPPMKVCAGGIDQTPQALALVQAAADFWAGVIEDAHQMTILVSWLDPAVSEKPDAIVVETDGLGRVTLGRVRLIPNTFTYFYDPTPQRDEEFLGRRTDSSSRLTSDMMRPKLYRTLHPEERDEAFLNFGSEILEVGYNGLAQEPPGAPEIGKDLLTEALHEVGHLFGLAHPLNSCNENVIPSGYVPPLNLTGGVPIAIKAYQFTNDEGQQQIDCAHLAAGGITACKPPPGDQSTTSPEDSTLSGPTIHFSIHDCTSHQALNWFAEYPGGRTRPSIVDILAIAVAEGWQQIDLPRKYSLGTGGAWNAPQTWFGNRAPDAGDDVYVVNQQGPDPFTIVTSTADAAARNLFVSDENRVEVTGSQLSIARTVWLAGPKSVEGPVRPIIDPVPGGEEIPIVPSTLEVAASGFAIGDALGVEPAARLRLRDGGQAQFGDVINTGSIEGHGTLGVARSLKNGTSASENGTATAASGLIRAEGGLLRIVTPAPGGITTGPPVVDLDGPAPTGSPTPPRLWALDGDIEIDAMVKKGLWADIRIGAGRTLRFVRNGIQQNASSDAKFALRFQGGAVGATLDAPPSQFFGIVLADGIGRFTGRVRFGGAASVRLSLGGTVAGTQYDQLQVQDVAELGGTLQVSLDGGFVPQAGDSFTVLTYASRVGEFNNAVLPALQPGLAWHVQYGLATLQLVVTDASDVDGDGDIDNSDLHAIIDHFGPCPVAPAACPWDLNGDGVVDHADVVFWQQNN